MKSLKQLFFVVRDKHTETIKPGILSVLARATYFPDGETLLTKWERDVKKNIEIKCTDEVATYEDSTYRWNCTKFGNKSFTISGRFRPNVDNIPTIIDKSGEQTVQAGSLVITRMDENGEQITENIPYGNSGIIEQYRFPIPMPTKFAEDLRINMASASINMTEGSESHFMSKHTIHDCFTEYKNGVLSVYVNHFKNIDAIDLSELPYISGDFSITISGVFL